MISLLAVYDGNNALVMRFEYADARMPFAMTMGGAVYYLAYDQVGSLRVVADGSGTVVKRIDYDSFGNVFYDSAPDFPVPFGFAGGLYDKDTKLVRFGYRDYDPDTGRWTAKDPIGFGGGDTDLYGYCVNDPVNLVDPRGLETRIVIGKDTTVGIRTGHVGYWSEHGGQDGGPFVYDPSGSYKLEERGNLPYLEGKEADWNDYLNKQKEGGEEVEVFTFPTTEILERAIANYARKKGNDPRGFNCAKFVSNTISEFGPFMHIIPTVFPGDLAEQLRKIPQK